MIIVPRVVLRGGATSRRAVAWSAACPRTATPMRHASPPRTGASATAPMEARARSSSPAVIPRDWFAHAPPPAAASASARNAIPSPVSVSSASSTRTAARTSRGASIQIATHAEATTIAPASAATSSRSPASTNSHSVASTRRIGPPLLEVAAAMCCPATRARGVARPARPALASACAPRRDTASGDEAARCASPTRLPSTVCNHAPVLSTRSVPLAVAVLDPTGWC